MDEAGIPEDAPALVAPATRPEFGDYQANGVMAAAKKLKTNPRALAEKVAAAATEKLAPLAGPPEIAWPGFLNIRINEDFLADRLGEALSDDRLGVDRPDRPQTVVVDYSGPNLAKEMHVGHLRSTIIGDALARVLEFVGHKVIRQNHVGDWGTQFGMLIAYLDVLNKRVESEASADVIHTEVARIEDLEEFYRQAKLLFDKDPAFAQASREYVVKLQAGDAEVHKSWERFWDLSWEHCVAVYKKLGITWKRWEEVRGESAYNDNLPEVVKTLDDKGLLRESDGAQCVFPEGFIGADDKPLPVIVQKSDGGYLYATTDLAALRYRADTLEADRILYVTDSRQALHFRQVFAVARTAEFVGKNVSLEHVPFGMMLDTSRQPFKTREGGTVKLMDLLDEAEKEAGKLVGEKNPNLSEADVDIKKIAHVVGIGAVKYADLSQNRTSDYVFSWDKMLSLDGNTAPYMQYAYARICSIFRKAGEMPPGPSSASQTSRDRQGAGKGPGEAADGTSGAIPISHPAERGLAVKLAQFPETVDTVASECLPNVLCAYLFELAGAFMGFYEDCPVLQSDQPVRENRLRLCELTARTIETGLGLLGIGTIDQM